MERSIFLSKSKGWVGGRPIEASRNSPEPVNSKVTHLGMSAKMGIVGNVGSKPRTEARCTKS